jgi:ribosome biogenesis protein BRX1
MLLPHSKKEQKLDSKQRLDDLNEIAELSNCNNALYFETRKHQDHYMWISKTPNGPSAKFICRNIHTMDELQMTGNALKGSRPVLSFDQQFNSEPHLQLLKEMFTQIFATPRSSRKIKPFVDRVMSFSILDNKVWIRNYQIVENSDAQLDKKEQNPISLVEIGPRFVLQLIRIFDGSFGGSTLFENSEFVTPNNARRIQKGQTAIKHQQRQQQKGQRTEKLKKTIEEDPIDQVFQ